MHRLRSVVPSANYLFVFEAAARRLSFTAAADELNVSQPAVSKTISALEVATGLKLFNRDRGQMELTTEGKRLYQETQETFDQLYSVITSLRKKHSKDVVSFSASFVQFWLLPRLNAFTLRYPGVSRRIEESARDDQNLDVEDIDISGRLGKGNWPGVRSWHFVDEEVLPVCSPGYLLEHGPIHSAADLPGQTLLHFEERHRLRLPWLEWLKYCGISRPKLAEGLVFTDNLSSIEAAVLGRGVALGWKHLVREHLRAGRLVAVTNASYRSGDAIYLVCRPSACPKPVPSYFEIGYCSKGSRPKSWLTISRHLHNLLKMAINCRARYSRPRIGISADNFKLSPTVGFVQIRSRHRIGTINAEPK